MPPPVLSTGTRNFAFIEKLRTTLLNTMGTDLRDESRSWVIMDFPSQLNCGDSAIWLGERAAARALGATVTRAVDRRNAASADVDADSLVLIHGGGNFGGLYSTHEDLRIRALQKYRGRRVVQLPQSIEWASSESRETMKRAVGEHGDFLLYVRDSRSFDRATADLDCDVRLVPDAAFALGPLDRPKATSSRIVVQRRTDKEAPIGSSDLELDSFDWLEAPRTSRRALSLTAVEKAFALSRRIKGRNIRIDSVLAQSLAKSNLVFAQRRLSSGSAVATDRLHGHVISTLMSVDNCVVDDSHGKIRALWETWTNGSPCASFVPDWATAVDWMKDRESND